MKIKTKKLLVILPPTIIIILWFLKDSLIMLVKQLPICPVYRLFGIPCPGCGNSRSVISLLHFDILSSLRYNPAPLFLSILAFCFYIEFFFYCFDKKIKIVPRSNLFLFSCLFLFSAYYLIRIFIPFLNP